MGRAVSFLRRQVSYTKATDSQSFIRITELSFMEGLDDGSALFAGVGALALVQHFAGKFLSHVFIAIGLRT